MRNYLINQVFHIIVHMIYLVHMFNIKIIFDTFVHFKSMKPCVHNSTTGMLVVKSLESTFSPPFFMN